MQLDFEGTFAAIALNSDEEIKSVYIGEGNKLSFEKVEIVTPSE